MTNKADSAKPGSNYWPRGGEAKTSNVNAVMADHFKSQASKLAKPAQAK